MCAQNIGQIYFTTGKAGIHHAALRGDLKEVRSFIENGQDINAIYLSQSPLLVACGSIDDYYKAAIIFSNHDSTKKQFYLHHYTSSYYHQSTVEYLIEKGADINIRDESSRTALDLSCIAGKAIIVKKLLDLGATINWDSNFFTLEHALIGGNLDVIRLLLKRHADVYYRSISLIKFLEMAIQKMWDPPSVCEIVESLLEKGADVNFRSPYTMETPLHLLCKNVAYTPVKLLKLLLNYKANINAHDMRNNTPLTYFFYKYFYFTEQDYVYFFNKYEEYKIDIILDFVSQMRKSNKLICTENENILKDYQRIKHELVFMKTPLSELNGLSLYKAIIKDIDLAGSILEDHSIFKRVTEIITEKLPKYGNSLKNKCLRALSRRLIFLSARRVFYEHILCYKLPLEIVEKCCKLLSTRHLRRLSKARNV